MKLPTVDPFDDSHQERLDQVISSYLSHEDINDVLLYLKKTRHVFIGTEGMLRLTQSILQQLTQAPISHTDDIFSIFAEFHTKSLIPSVDLGEQLLGLISRVIASPLTTPITVRNAFLVMTILTELYSIENLLLSKKSVTVMIEHCNAILSSTEHQETLLYALLLADKLINSKLCPGHGDALTVQLAGQILSISAWQGRQSEDLNPYNQQGVVLTQSIIEFLANLYCRHYANEDQSFRTLKLSANGLWAINTNVSSGLFPVRSAFAITSGVYYYEAILLTAGRVLVGWATREYSWSNRTNSSKYAILFNCHTSNITHKNMQFNYRTEPPSRNAGDVIGLLIDSNNRKFQFYVNGRQVSYKMKVHFSPQAYYAVAQLNNQQSCYFNFGQLPFKHPPSNIKFSNFHSTCMSTNRKYHLLEPVKDSHKFWFKDEPINGAVEKMFIDILQMQFNNWVQNLSRVIINSSTDSPAFEELEHQLANLLLYNDGLNILRLTQAIIETLDGELQNDQLVQMISWMSIHLNSLSQDYGFDCQLFELISPYLYLDTNSNANILIKRNLYIALICVGFIDTKYIPKVLFVCFVETLLNDKPNGYWCATFCLLQLTQLVGKFSYHEQQGLDISSELKKLAALYHETSLFELYNQEYARARFQIGFFAQWLLKEKQNQRPNQRILQYPLLSSDRFFAANPLLRGVQTVQSEFRVTSEVCYYEVVLIEGTHLKIGWSTNRREFNEVTWVGDRNFSIGLSCQGFARIYHDGQAIDCANELHWTEGDVVGCLIDVPRRKFAFYLNGTSILFPGEDVPFSDDPYFAAITLDSLKRCYVNFGQWPFKHLPQFDEPIRSFQSASNGVQSRLRESISAA